MNEAEPSHSASSTAISSPSPATLSAHGSGESGGHSSAEKLHDRVEKRRQQHLQQHPSNHSQKYHRRASTHEAAQAHLRLSNSSPPPPRVVRISRSGSGTSNSDSVSLSGSGPSNNNSGGATQSSTFSSSQSTITSSSSSSSSSASPSCAGTPNEGGREGGLGVRSSRPHSDTRSSRRKRSSSSSSSSSSAGSHKELSRQQQHNHAANSRRRRDPQQLSPRYPNAALLLRPAHERAPERYSPRSLSSQDVASIDVSAVDRHDTTYRDGSDGGRSAARDGSRARHSSKSHARTRSHSVASSSSSSSCSLSDPSSSAGSACGSSDGSGSVGPPSGATCDSFSEVTGGSGEELERGVRQRRHHSRTPSGSEHSQEPVRDRTRHDHGHDRDRRDQRERRDRDDANVAPTSPVAISPVLGGSDSRISISTRQQTEASAQADPRRRKSAPTLHSDLVGAVGLSPASVCLAPRVDASLVAAISSSSLSQPWASATSTTSTSTSTSTSSSTMAFSVANSSGSIESNLSSSISHTPVASVDLLLPEPLSSGSRIELSSVSWSSGDGEDPPTGVSAGSDQPIAATSSSVSGKSRRKQKKRRGRHTPGVSKSSTLPSSGSRTAMLLDGESGSGDTLALQEGNGKPRRKSMPTLQDNTISTAGRTPHGDPTLSISTPSTAGGKMLTSPGRHHSTSTSTSISTSISITTNPRQTRICPLLPPKSTRQPPPTPRAKPLCAPPITRTARTKSPLRTTAKAQPPFVHPPRVTLRRHCLASNCTRPFALPTAIRLPTRTQPPPLPPAPVPAPKAPHTRVTGDYAHLVPSSVRLASTHHNVMMRPRRSIAITLIAIRSTISRTMIRPRDRFPLLPRWIRTATRSDIAVSDSSVHVRIRNGPPLLVLSQHP
mmetsp:Transcript_2142/g.6768  ORF Transcript_2142/g.6768 Transcript_2142/m.6768 type:complete len:892 (-) Transcript_2142:1629-4304(-)